MRIVEATGRDEWRNMSDGMTQRTSALPDSSTEPTRSRWIAPAVAVILFAGLAAYSNSFRGAFVFDDILTLEQPTARKLLPIWPTIAGVRPVAQFTFALSHRIGGLWAYHGFNLAIHILAALTLFGIVRRTLTLPKLAPRFGRDSTLLAFCIALLWMLHPLQTESVTYIIQRMESLMGLFLLLTLYCAVRGFSQHGSIGHGTHLVCGSDPLACALGMGSKEVMVTAPLLVLIYDRTFIAGSFREALRRRWGFYLAFAATGLILARQIAAAFAAHADSAGFHLSNITPFEYARSEPGVIEHYLALAFWPGGLCLDYGRPVARAAGEILPGAIVVGALLTLTIWALVRRPAWGFIGAWFFLALAPTSSILPIKDLACEHRMYLPLAAVVAAAVIAAYVATQKLTDSRLPEPLRRGSAVSLALALAAALGYVTFLRNKDYRSGVAIWQDVTEKRPENPRGWNYLGNAYAADGQPVKAISSIDHAISLRSEYADAYYNRAWVYLALNRFPEAIRDCDQAIALSPDFAAAFNNRGLAYSRMGRDDLAIGDYDRAIEMKPDFVAAYCNRALTHTNLGRYDLAVYDCDSAIALDPDSADAYSNRAFAYLQLRQFDRALQDYDRVVALKPDWAEAYNNRAVADVHFDRYDLALRDCTRAIELKSDYLDAHLNRARVYYRMKEYQKALADLKTFQNLGGQPAPGFLKALTEAAGNGGK